MERRVNEDGGLRRMGMDVQEHLEHVVAQWDVLLEVVADHLHFMDPPVL